MSREVDAAGLRKLDLVFRFELLLNSSATDIVLVTLLKHGSWNSNCAVHYSLGNGEVTPPLPRTLPSFWRRSTDGLSGLFRAVSAVEPSFFPPPSPLSPTLIHLASVDVKQKGPESTRLQLQICVPPWLPPSTVKRKEKKRRWVGGEVVSRGYNRPRQSRSDSHSDVSLQTSTTDCDQTMTTDCDFDPAQHSASAETTDPNK